MGTINFLINFLQVDEYFEWIGEQIEEQMDTDRSLSSDIDMTDRSF